MSLDICAVLRTVENYAKWTLCGTRSKHCRYLVTFSDDEKSTNGAYKNYTMMRRMSPCFPSPTLPYLTCETVDYSTNECWWLYETKFLPSIALINIRSNPVDCTHDAHRASLELCSDLYQTSLRSTTAASKVEHTWIFFKKNRKIN